MPLSFITGNAGKFADVQALIPDVVQVDLVLDEIQSLDPQVVIAHKLEQARAQCAGEILVEDTSLYVEGLGGLPGPFIKWFMDALGKVGFADLVQKTGQPAARAVTWLGHCDEVGVTRFYSGEVKGVIVPPIGSEGFGWDALFVPQGSDRTFAQMSHSEKLRYNMRRMAVEHFLEERLA